VELHAPEATAVDLKRVTRSSTVRSLRRLNEIGYVTTRRIGPVLVRKPFTKDNERWKRQLGRALAGSVSDLGVTFVKLGQILASSPSIAGETLSSAMRGVLDDGPALPFETVQRVIERDLGKAITQVFRSIDSQPFAAASLAVVHRATLLDGTDVAVKVLRPHSAQVVATDLSLVRPLVNWLARTAPIGFLPAIPDTIEGLAEQLSEELDLRNEAAIMAWFAAVTEIIDAKGVRVPKTFPEATGKSVLTMEFIEGSKIDDLDAIAEGDIDIRNAMESLIEAWFALALCTGVFHGDMHAGNLLLTPDGEVVLLDWGIVGRLPEASRTFFRRSLEGALGDESAWPDVRDHFVKQLPMDSLETMGITPDMLMEMIRAQTLMIMTAPFNELNLMMLMPNASNIDKPDGPPMPSSPREMLKLIRAERKKVKESGYFEALAENSPPRGEMLLVKQLVFFERYGKMFLGDQPLIYDPDVYRTLLAMSAPDPA
jgi:serine/threonine protein kinase